MTSVQQLYAALAKANGDYASGGSDAECAAACAQQSEAVAALTAARCETAWDLALKTRVAHDIARDESSEDGHYTDGRLAWLLASIDRDAVALARRFDDLESKVAA